MQFNIMLCLICRDEILYVYVSSRAFIPVQENVFHSVYLIMIKIVGNEFI